MTPRCCSLARAWCSSSPTSCTRRSSTPHTSAPLRCRSACAPTTSTISAMLATCRSSRCWATSASAATSSARCAHGPSSSPRRCSAFRRTSCTSPCSRTTTRPSRFGSRSAWPKTTSPVWARMITSGAPGLPARAARAPKSTSIRAPRWVAAVPTASRAAIATASWSTGTACSPSTTARKMARWPRLRPRTSIPAWALSAWRPSCRALRTTTTPTCFAVWSAWASAWPASSTARTRLPTCACASWPTTAARSRS